VACICTKRSTFSLDSFLNPQRHCLQCLFAYRDGTTDITRTVHFGTPPDRVKDCYTRVLKGQLAVVMAVWPTNTVGHRLDTLARQALWEVGLEV